MFFNLYEICALLVSGLDIFIFVLVVTFVVLLFFYVVMFDFSGLVESLKDFGKLFFLCISQFFILNRFLEFLDKYFLDLLWVFVFSEKVEKEVDVESAFSLVGKRFEHC